VEKLLDSYFDLTSFFVLHKLDLCIFFLIIFLTYTFIHFLYKKSVHLSVRSTWTILFLSLLSLIFVEDGTNKIKTKIFDEMKVLSPDLHLLMDQTGSHQISLLTQPSDTIYLSLIELQKTILQNNRQISDVYTLTKNADGQFAFLVDSETDYNHDGYYSGERELRTPIGEVYTVQNDLLNKVWMNGAPDITRAPYHDKWGYWVSVFVPLRYDNGQIYSVLGIDYSADKLIRALTIDRTKKFTICYIVILIVSICLISRSLILMQQKQIIQYLNEKLQLAEELDIQKIKAAETSKMAALGEMAAGIAHEINGPLTIIRGRAQQLLRAVNEDRMDQESFHKLLSVIELTTLRIAKIVSGLKTFSRNAEKDPFVPTSVQSLIDHTMIFCIEKFETNSVSLAYAKNMDCEVNIREAQISQVLLNLINNAFDAVEKLKDPWVQVDVQIHDEKWVDILVIDSGPGISDELVEKIMKPFFTTKEVGKGTGLGLSISKEIIEEHGGQLILDRSSLNTKFIVRLPRLIKKS